MNDVLDIRLREVLDSIETPEHGAGFHDTLVANVCSEAAARLRARSAWPGFARSGRARLRLALAAAAVAAAVAVVLTIVGVPGLRSTHPSTASAAAVIAKITEGMASVNTARGRYIQTGNGATAIDYQLDFIVTARGDVRWQHVPSQPGGPPDDISTYDAARNVYENLSLTSAPGTFSISRDLDISKPMGWGDLADTFRWQASFVRAMLAGEVPGWTVTNSTYDSRPAWIVSGPLPQLPTAGIVPSPVLPDHDEFTVDKATGFVMRTRAFTGDRLVGEERLVDVRLNVPIPAGSFGVNPPAGVKVSRSDDGWHSLSLSQVGAKLGFVPLVPDAEPTGFSLSQVLGKTARYEGPGGKTMEAVPGGLVLCYRRGFDRFTVFTEPLKAATTDRLLGSWSMPGVDSPSATVLQGGALAMATAKVVIGPFRPSHLWVRGRGLLVIIGGDLTGAELVSVAESLQLYRP
jgi:outer membrane lipoprotein-sorting protein